MTLDDLPPDAMRLATVVSIAARVEPELLRSARLRLLPGVDASAEGDLWFSDLVARSAKRVVFLPDAAAALRERLAADTPLLRAARAVVAEVHTNAPAVVQLEEEVTYLALTGDDVAEKINSKLLTVLNTIASEKRPGLVEWVARALPRMPRKARETAAAAALELICGSGETPLMRVQRSVMSNPELAALLVRALPSTTIWARLISLDDDLGLELSRQTLTSAHALNVPETTPLLVELTTERQSEIVEVPSAGSVTRPIVREAALRTLAGDVYRLTEDRPEAHVPSHALAVGDIVTGQVLDVTAAHVRVDLGYRVEGLLPVGEADRAVRIGDEIEVTILRLNDPSGYVALGSARPARAWLDIQKAYDNDQPIAGRIVARVKGGLQADVGGVKAFVPGSLLGTRPVKDVEALVGQELQFKVVALDMARKNVVLSRRAVVEVEEAALKARTLARLREGELVRGVVKNITDYGVFFDLGGIDGLLHITDISWGRVNHPVEYFNIGDDVELVVLKFDAASERVSLGYKQKTPDPWLDVPERYPLGSLVKGRAVSITDYGVFVELEEGVEGLLHVSEMSWTKKSQHPSKVYAIGDEVQVAVADVDVPQRRISLSKKLIEPDPWATIAERYPVGAVIEGRVRNLTDFGAFVEVEEGIDGLVHISDMSLGRRLDHPSQVLKKGERVRARVINVDPANHRLALSIREFVPNPLDEFIARHQLGQELVGTVSKVVAFGVFVHLAEGVEGLMHISEVVRAPGQALEDRFQPGDPVRVRIVRIDPIERKIALSMRDVEPLTEEELKQLSETPSEEATAPPEDAEPGT